MAYVSTDGNYGAGDSIHFDSAELTDEQWLLLDNLADSDRYDFVYACVNGDEETVQEYFDTYAY
jgi:hypothetical protein